MKWSDYFLGFLHGATIATSLTTVLMLSSCNKAEAGTLERTAVVALKEAANAPDGGIYEYSGIIVKRQGAYVYSYFPHTDKMPGSVSYEIDEVLSPGDKLAGVYHTHPCYKGYLGDYYSLPDLMVTIFFEVPAFILSECNGNVHEFVWGVDKVQDTGETVKVKTANGDKVMHLPAGRIVGNIGKTFPLMELTQ